MQNNTSNNVGESVRTVHPIGKVFTHPTLGNVVIIAVHPLGTVDVRNIYTDRCYRLSGLRIVESIKDTETLTES